MENKPKVIKEPALLNDRSCCQGDHHSEAEPNVFAEQRRSAKKYFCPMCEGVESDTPGSCPNCGSVRALPPSMRERYVARIAELLRPGGVLAGFFFYSEKDPDGPPFPLPRQTAITLFERDFRLRHSEQVTDSLPIFAGREEWQEWKSV